MSSDESLSYDGIPYANQFDSRVDFGATFMGFLAQFFLYGIFMALFVDYLSSKNYRRDALSSRVLLWTVVALNSISTALNAYLAIFHGTSQDRSVIAMYQITVPDRFLNLPGGLIASIVQVFLARRASQLFKNEPTKQKLFLTLVCSLVVFAFIACATMPVVTWAYADGWDDKFGGWTYNLAAAVWLWLSAGVDVILTATLIVCLRRSVLGFNKSTDSAIHAVIRTALTSAVPSAVFAVAGALLSVGWGAQNNLWTVMFQTMATPLASLYALSLLNTLSSRKPLKREKAAVVGSASWISGQQSGEKVPVPARPSLAARTISKMSIPTINLAGSQVEVRGVEGGISFTRDVIECVEQSEEVAPRAGRRPYVESYIDDG